MEFKKQVLGRIEQCYAALGVGPADRPLLFFGGEGNGSLSVYHGAGFGECTRITEGGGGTMSIVPLKRREGWVLFSRGFYSMVRSETSVIEIARQIDGRFRVETVAALPYLHRFGLVSAPDGTDYLIAATIADYKEDMEDWSRPGHLYYAAMPENPDDSFSLEFARLPGDYYMNHGFCTAVDGGRERAFIGCREGLFAVTPPEQAGGTAEIGQILDVPVSDVGVADIDGDGENEIAALMPFHGDRCKIYKKLGGVYREVYDCPAENDFYHAVSGTSLGGENVFVVGARHLAAQLFLLRFDKEKNEYRRQVIENGAGPSNVSVLHTETCDIILSANRMVAEAAMYLLQKKE